jgi:preprotein translocase subunit SecD
LGGDDIAYVCRSSTCSGIDTERGCGQMSTEEWACGFAFTITLSPQAAGRQAAATSNLEVLIDETGQGYLSENLTLYLDDQVVDELRIASELKGSATTQIRITGSGTGLTARDAEADAILNMKKLQTVLITGSLPVKLSIVKTDAISPALGEAFIKNVLFMGLVAMIAVIIIILARYHSLRIALPMIVTMLSEVIILMGISALFGWRLDLAAIAGVIISVGTGVNDQIVIADETIKKRQDQLNWKERLSRAFFIIMAAYFVIVMAMLPLWFAGAGLLKGFALTTVVGVTVGVFITRPAYSRFIEYIGKE